MARSAWSSGESCTEGFAAVMTTRVPSGVMTASSRAFHGRIMRAVDRPAG